jgi:adenylyltransferase/sulfurtransferase
MPGKFHHEQLYRGADAVAKLAEAQLTLCGAGALGSHLADNLVRQGVRRLRVVDDDRVAEHNVSTQIYGEAEVGGRKVEVLRNRLFRAAGVEIEALPKRLTDRTARQLLNNCCPRQVVLP